MTDSPPLAAPVAVLALAAGALSGVQQFAPVVLDLPVDRVGTLLFAVSVAGFLLSPVLVFAAGYWAGTRVHVPGEYGRVALVFGVVGGIASLVGYGAVVAVGVAPDAGDLGMVALSSLHTTVLRAVSYAITGVAGASVAHFRTAERNP